MAPETGLDGSSLVDSKCLHMAPVAPNCSKWLQMASNGPRRLQIAPHGLKWLKVTTNGLKCLQMAPNCSKWLKWLQIFKWLKLSPTVSNWIQTAPNGLNWLKLAQTGSNWLHRPPPGSNWLQLAPTALLFTSIYRGKFWHSPCLDWFKNNSLLARNINT